jgi:hypothetical protein
MYLISDSFAWHAAILQLHLFFAFRFRPWSCVRAALRGIWDKGSSFKSCVKIASWEDSDVGVERAVPGDMLKSAFAPVGDGEEMVRFKEPPLFIDNRTCAPAVSDGFFGGGLYMCMYHRNIYLYIYIYVYTHRGMSLHV